MKDNVAYLKYVSLIAGRKYRKIREGKPDPPFCGRVFMFAATAPSAIAVAGTSAMAEAPKLRQNESRQ
jgi:hypothetical protein